MDLFAEVKDKVPIIEAMGRYGLSPALKGNRYWLLCPFHRERTPSLCVYPETNSFYCYGCGASGDVITFASKLYNISLKDAAYKLANDFNLIRSGDRAKHIPNNTDNVVYEKYKRRCEGVFNFLCDIRKTYQDIEGSVETENDLDKPEVVEALHMIPLIDYWLDTLIYQENDIDETLHVMREVNLWLMGC